MNEREEGKGMRLLRKGKRGLIQAIFSRLGLIVLLFLLQLALLLGLFSAAAEFLPHFFGGTIVFNAIIVIYLLNSEGDPTAKLTWLVFFSVAPVFGALFYLYTKSDIGHRLLRERTTQLIREGAAISARTPAPSSIWKSATHRLRAWQATSRKAAAILFGSTPL